MVRGCHLLPSRYRLAPAAAIDPGDRFLFQLMTSLTLHRPTTDRNAAALIALSCCTVVITGSLSELFHFQFSSLHTAMLMYLPVLAVLGILLPSTTEIRGRFPEARGFVLLAFLCGCWLVNYLLEITSSSCLDLSNYDRKRMWFFVHGVLLSGLLGILAARRAGRFIRPFLGFFCIASTTASLLYLLSYRPDATFTRLLGEKALGVGMTAAFGMASCFALLLLQVEGSSRFSRSAVLALIAAIIVDLAAVVLSATRGAALCCLASATVFVWMMRRSRFLPFLIVFLALFSYGMVGLVRTYVPEAALNRLTMGEYGFGLRYELSGAVLDMIAEHPGGRIFGYEKTGLGMDYSHNAVLQYIAEAGLQSLPALTVLFCVAIWNLTSYRAELHVRAMTLFGLPVLLESCSGGSAYNFLLWFLLFFAFSLKRDRLRASALAAGGSGRQVFTRPARGADEPVIVSDG